MSPRLTLSTVTLSSADPHGLARFWAALLGLPAPSGEDPTWVVLRGGPVTLGFDLDQHHQAPQWPSRPDEPSLQVHLEVECDDLAEAVAHALGCGGSLAAYQPQDDVRVCLDPAGHPFCLWTEPDDQVA